MKYKIETAIYLKAQKLAEELRKLLFSCQEVEEDFEYLFVIGGDGTLIEVLSKYHDYSNLKIIGINGGNIGFLTLFNAENLKDLTTFLAKTDTCFDYYDLLKLKYNEQEHYAVNEVMLYANTVVDLDVYINEQFFQKFYGSGLVFSTKLGSTGLNRSVRGPIITPEVNGWIVNELFPYLTKNHHSLSVPMILANTNSVLIKSQNKFRPSYITLDGKLLDTCVACNQMDLSLIQSKAKLYWANKTNEYLQRLKDTYIK